MSRRPRVVLPGMPLHIIQRGNNRQACFFASDDYAYYLHAMGDYARDAGCLVHAYVLMTNHIHLLLTPEAETSVGQMMKALGQRYAQYVNRRYQRIGTLWQGRYRSCLTHEESYVLGCYRYIELNPVRAGMVAQPEAYPWSSYRTNAAGEPSAWVTPHDCYLALGGDDQARREAYGALFRDQLRPDLIDQIRRATNGNYVLGSEAYQHQVGQLLERRVTPGQAGRPRVAGRRGAVAKDQ